MSAAKRIRIRVIRIRDGSYAIRAGTRALTYDGPHTIGNVRHLLEQQFVPGDRIEFAGRVFNSVADALHALAFVVCRED